MGELAKLAEGLFPLKLRLRERPSIARDSVDQTASSRALKINSSDRLALRTQKFREGCLHQSGIEFTGRPLPVDSLTGLTGSQALSGAMLERVAGESTMRLDRVLQSSLATCPKFLRQLHAREQHRR
jgi:hypothetical protein